MKKGFLTLAQNGTEDYVRMAYALALSLKTSQTKHANLSIIVNKDEEVPDKYLHVFDEIIYVDKVDTQWKVQNKWQYFWVSPYDETIVLDTDMLFFYDIAPWWDCLGVYNDLEFTTEVVNYRNEPITSTFYRKTFVEYGLPNLYTALFYFKKTEENENYFKLVKYIFENWEEFYSSCLTNSPSRLSGDVVYALAAKIMFTRRWENHLRFAHMRGRLQDSTIVDDWNKYLQTFFTKSNNKIGLKVNNYDQQYPFHYIKKNFLTDEVIEHYETAICLL